MAQTPIQDALKTIAKNQATSLEHRIEAIYEAAIGFRAQMDMARSTMHELEMAAKLDHGEERKEEYVKAKNGEIREMMLAEWLALDGEYQEAAQDYRTAKIQYRQCLLNIERLKVLVAARAGAAGMA